MSNAVAENVVSITERPQSELSTVLKESREAYDLAPFLYASDQRLGRAHMAVLFDRLTFAEREPYVTRAAIAIRLGDPLKTQVAHEHAAMALACDITQRIKAGAIGTESPEAQLRLSDWRHFGKVAVSRAIAYLGGTPRAIESPADDFNTEEE